MKAVWIAVCATALVAPGAAANILTISAAKGGPVVAGVNYVNFDDLALGSTTQTATGPNGSVLVTPAVGGRVAQGNIVGIQAPPWLYNNQGAFFGGQPDGLDATPYLTAASGPITLSFSGPQKYVGVLWSSPDHGQALQLYSNTLGLIGSVGGADLFAYGIVNPGDDYRSAYVNINSELPFDYVVATPWVFEFDNLAYFAENVVLPGQVISLPPGGPLGPLPSVPDAGSATALLTLAALGCLGFRRALASSS